MRPSTKGYSDYGRRLSSEIVDIVMYNVPGPGIYTSVSANERHVNISIETDDPSRLAGLVSDADEMIALIFDR